MYHLLPVCLGCEATSKNIKHRSYQLDSICKTHTASGLQKCAESAAVGCSGHGDSGPTSSAQRCPILSKLLGLVHVEALLQMAGRSRHHNWRTSGVVFDLLPREMLVLWPTVLSRLLQLLRPLFARTAPEITEVGAWSLNWTQSAVADAALSTAPTYGGGPRLATFDAPSKRNPDALPQMPSWNEAKTHRVELGYQQEPGELPLESPFRATSISPNALLEGPASKEPSSQRADINTEQPKAGHTPPVFPAQELETRSVRYPGIHQRVAQSNGRHQEVDAEFMRPPTISNNISNTYGRIPYNRGQQLQHGDPGYGNLQHGYRYGAAMGSEPRAPHRLSPYDHRPGPATQSHQYRSSSLTRQAAGLITASASPRQQRSRQQKMINA